MWNGGRHPGSDDNQEDNTENEQNSRLTAAAALAAAYGSPGTVDASQYRYDAFANPYPHPGVPMYTQQAAVEAMRQQQTLFSQQAQVLHHQQEYHQLEFARQQMQHRQDAAELLHLQQEQARVAHEAERRRQQTDAVDLMNLQQDQTLAARDSELRRMTTEQQDAADLLYLRHDQTPVAREQLQPQTAEQNAALTESATEQPMEVEVQSEPQPPDPSQQQTTQPQQVVARGKPEALATALAARVREEIEQEEPVATAVPVPEEEKPAAVASNVAVATAVADATPEEHLKKKRKRKPSTTPRKKPHIAGSGGSTGHTLNDAVPDITDAEYDNVKALMEQFCRVPLLAEFSRPVSLLHPELIPIYSRIVAHPIDLGTVCRGIRRRKYKNTRAIRLDMWRIFANCTKYHTDPSNKDNAVPSFVSIALHLREYFNALWQEYMVPSDPPPVSAGGKQPRGSASVLLRAAFEKREAERVARLKATGATVLSERCLEKTAAAIRSFIETGGIVDKLDMEPIFGFDVDDDDGDVDVVIKNFQELQKGLDQISQSDQEYSVEELERDMKRCYTLDVFENRPMFKVRFGHRVDRLLGKIIVPIYETSGRGVNQSSIWGCMAAAIWARESSKKPYWPALVLGIMAPEDQTEDWHTSLTDRNERRLPQKLRTELLSGKRKAEQAIRRQKAGSAEQMSYFLVEFMGTHEFIWVKESDIIENFDPDVDPNLEKVTKKKRSSRVHDVSSTKAFLNALDEGRWALEEFDMQLNDSCGDINDEEEDEEEMNYSYTVLCQSDDEADEQDGSVADEAGEMTMSDVEEANELLSTDGLLDFSAEGRKNARKRAAARKKEKAAALKKEKSDQAKKVKGQKAKVAQKKPKGDRQDKRELRELEKRRKKRSREREKLLREKARKIKREVAELSWSDDDNYEKVDLEAVSSKRGRASALVRGYLMRTTTKEDLRTLGLGGSMSTIPASALDSSGLLGMALAFRAASGALDFSDGSDHTSKTRPWEGVDVDSPVTSEERLERLKEQASLLEAEIRHVRDGIAERKRLTEVAKSRRDEIETEIFANEKATREIIHKRPKKKSRSTAKPKAAPKSENVVPEEKESCGNNVEPSESIDKDSVADIGEQSKSRDQRGEAVPENSRSAFEDKFSSDADGNERTVQMMRIVDTEAPVSF